MSIALVHYHLRPGGVTRIVERQSEALTTAGISHVILTGSPPEQNFNLPIRVIPELDYSETQPHQDTGASLLVGQLRAAAIEALGHEPQCWHLHNPTLGKNQLFPQLVRTLAESQVPLVMHIHDLAEDGRPENYRLLRSAGEIYPIAPQIHYLTINSRDLSRLRHAGIPPQQTSLLRNAVTLTGLTDGTPPNDEKSALVLYPVRGIRRKNLGEFCLLAGLAPDPTQFALALPPSPSQENSAYQKWIELAKRQRLPLQMGVVGAELAPPGGDSTFPAWARASTHFITTSIAEGFGLTFLEAIAFGRPLIGRDLPEITSDFRRHGINLNSLYSGLLFPRQWIDEARLHSILETRLQHLYRSCGEQLSDSIVTETAESLFSEELLDFGNLPESLQLEILPRALASPGKILCREANTLLPADEWLQGALQRTGSNTPGDLDPWSSSAFSQAHRDLYDSLAVCRAAKPTWLDPRSILLQYLHPPQFHFLRS